MKIYIFHGYYLCMSAACSTALYSEHGTERRLAQRKHRFFTYSSQPVPKTYRCGRFPFACGSRRYRRHKYKLPFPCLTFSQKRKIDFCLCLSVRLDVFFIYFRKSRYFIYRLRFCRLSYFYIGFNIHMLHSFATSILLFIIIA